MWSSRAWRLITGTPRCFPREPADGSILSTAKSALEAGLKTYVPLASVRGIDENGVQRALEQIKSMGGIIVEGEDWEAQLERLVKA